jgi:hypothetical protein
MTSYRIAHLAALASGTAALATATAAAPIVAELSPATPNEPADATPVPEPLELPS